VLVAGQIGEVEGRDPKHRPCPIQK
jgi:hypothetical protein